MIGLPWLGASVSRIFLGITVVRIWSPRWRLDLRFDLRRPGWCAAKKVSGAATTTSEKPVTSSKRQYRANQCHGGSDGARQNLKCDGRREKCGEQGKVYTNASAPVVAPRGVAPNLQNL